MLTIEVSGQDAACESIDLQHPPSSRLKLVIKGQTLTLGDPDGPTTSTIDGDIIFKKDGNDPARLEVHDWVTFTALEFKTGTIEALKIDNSPLWAEFIRDGSNGIGAKFVEGAGKLVVIGHFQFLISVMHDASFFGNESDTVMKFGLEGADPFVPDLQISGTALNAKKFEAFVESRMEFHEVNFASNSPSWLVTGTDSEIRVTATLNNVPNDIEIVSNGLLNLRADFTCNGKLTQQSATIRVKAGKRAIIFSGI